MSDNSNVDPAENLPGEVVEHQPPASERSLARRISLQILYEIDSAGHDAPTVTGVHLQARQVNRKAARYVRRLVNGVMTHRQTLDATIAHYAPEWPVEQIAIVDRNILRLAILELAVQTTTPVGVAIDEAVQLAKIYGADSTPGFVNGVLGALADDDDMLRRLHAVGAGVADNASEAREDGETKP